ncbi:hypothetical protein IID04_06980 [PVC group bacterium]|nr:hypothetical protein [PVC group bacterium]
MHRTLKKEATIPAERNIKRQQRRFEHFQEEYNMIRPYGKEVGKKGQPLT